MAAAVIGASAVHAMRIQLTLPKWNNEQPYAAMLAGGQRTSLPLPELVFMRNRVAQASTALGRGHANMATACETLQQVLRFASDAVNVIALRPPPGGQDGNGHGSPSAASSALCEALQPQPPEDLAIDVFAAGNPPQFHFSAYITRNGVAVDARHASVHCGALEERLRLLGCVVREARGLLDKLQTLAEMCECQGIRLS